MALGGQADHGGRRSRLDFPTMPYAAVFPIPRGGWGRRSRPSRPQGREPDHGRHSCPTMVEHSSLGPVRGRDERFPRGRRARPRWSATSTMVGIRGRTRPWSAKSGTAWSGSTKIPFGARPWSGSRPWSPTILRSLNVTSRGGGRRGRDRRFEPLCRAVQEALGPGGGRPAAVLRARPRRSATPLRGEPGGGRPGSSAACEDVERLLSEPRGERAWKTGGPAPRSGLGPESPGGC